MCKQYSPRSRPVAHPDRRHAVVAGRCPFAVLGGDEDAGLSISCLLTPILACEEVLRPLLRPRRPYSEMVIPRTTQSRMNMKNSDIFY